MEELPEIGLEPIVSNDTTRMEVEAASPTEQAIAEIAHETIADLPTAEGCVDPGRISPVPEELTEKVEKVAFPNLLLETVKAGLSFEKAQIKKLEGLEGVANGHLDKINKLLDLNAKLTALPDKETQELSQEIKDLLAELKKEGIDLWKNNKITKDQKLQLKSLVNQHIERNRTQIAKTFNMIQAEMQSMSSVNDAVKQILQNMRQLMATLTRNQRPGG